MKLTLYLIAILLSLTTGYRATAQNNTYKDGKIGWQITMPDGWSQHTTSSRKMAITKGDTTMIKSESIIFKKDSSVINLTVLKSNREYIITTDFLRAMTRENLGVSPITTDLFKIKSGFDIKPDAEEETTVEISGKTLKLRFYKVYISGEYYGLQSLYSLQVGKYYWYTTILPMDDEHQKIMYEAFTEAVKSL